MEDRPYRPESWERKAGSAYYKAGKDGEPMPSNPKDNKYFEYLYSCGQQAALRQSEMDRIKKENEYQQWYKQNSAFLHRFLIDLEIF